jgi:alpha-mannosidase
LTAFKRSEDGNAWIVRLFEPTGQSRRTTLTLEALGLKIPLRLKPFEIRTLRIDPASESIRDVDLLERP